MQNVFINMTFRRKYPLLAGVVFNYANPRFSLLTLALIGLNFHTFAANLKETKWDVPEETSPYSSAW